MNPAIWQYRWLNPGNSAAASANELDWVQVTQDIGMVRLGQTMEERINELRAHRYGDKPVYEVRALYALGQNETIIGVPPGYQLVLVPTSPPSAEPDWDDCVRQAEEATGLKVERHTLSVVIREARRWLIQKQHAFKQHEHDNLRDNIGQAISGVLTSWTNKIDGTLTADVFDARVIDEVADAVLPVVADLTYPQHAIEEVVARLDGDDGEDDALTLLRRMDSALMKRFPGKTVCDLMDELEAIESLDEVESNVMPKVGEEVLIHLGRENQWVRHTVVGYYAWPDLDGDWATVRLFVRVRHPGGSLNARLLADVRRLDGEPFYAPKTPADKIGRRMVALTDSEIRALIDYRNHQQECANERGYDTHGDTFRAQELQRLLKQDTAASQLSVEDFTDWINANLGARVHEVHRDVLAHYSAAMLRGRALA